MLPGTGVSSGLGCAFPHRDGFVFGFVWGRGATYGSTQLTRRAKANEQTNRLHTSNKKVRWKSSFWTWPILIIFNVGLCREMIGESLLSYQVMHFIYSGAVLKRYLSIIIKIWCAFIRDSVFQSQIDHSDTADCPPLPYSLRCVQCQSQWKVVVYSLLFDNERLCVRGASTTNVPPKGSFRVA